MPDDNNTIPLINTIRETTLSAIAKKYKIETAQKRFDISHSQSDSEYITGAIDEYNDTIQDIIDNIPDDPPTPPWPTLPVVDHIGNTSVSNPPSNTSMIAYETLRLYFNGSRIPYDDAKKYAFSKVTASNGVVLTRTGFVAQKGSSSIWGYTDCVEAVNMTGATQSFVYYLDLYSCSSNLAETATVYDSNNNTFNAFKYTKDNVDYYWVLDGTQTDWTDDLSSIGYHLPVVLPIVTTSGYWNNNQYNWLQSTEGPENVPANSLSSVLHYGYAEGAQTVYVYPDYEPGKKYGIVQWQQSGGTTSGRTEFEIVESNGKMCVKNVSGGTLTFYQAKVAVCSSNQATVITVYNSSNTAYNAFKFTANNTDYYYVLDGTQTDWTDDLSSIGYSLTLQNPNAYFTTQGSSASSDFTFRGGTITPVYDAAGNAIPYDSSKTYTKIEVYNYAGQVVSDSLTNGLKFQNNSGYLVAVRNWATYDQTTQIYRIEYTVT